MNKTGYQVAGDVYQFVRGSALANAVNGGVYHAGTRPRDSRKEDIVIGFVAGAPADLQELVVNVNVFVPDVDPWNNGVLTPDVARLTELEGIAAEWAQSLTVADRMVELIPGVVEDVRNMFRKPGEGADLS